MYNIRRIILSAALLVTGLTSYSQVSETVNLTAAGTHTTWTNGSDMQSASYQIETTGLYDRGQTYKSRSQQYPEREKHPTMQKTNAQLSAQHKDGETWWEPDTVLLYLDYGFMARYLYSYTAQGLLSNKLGQEWKNNNWENNYKEIYTYDDRNNQLTYLIQNWQNNDWVNFVKETYTYDDRNNLLTYLYQFWQNDNWENNWKYTFTYDDRNNRLTGLQQEWQNNALENSYKITRTFDDRNNLLTHIVQFWQNNAWENRGKQIYTYDDRNNQLTGLQQEWQNNAWENSSKDTSTYDDRNNRLTTIDQDWQNNNWENSWEYTYTYDDRNNQLTVIEQEWQNNNWENSMKLTYAYDDRNNLLTYITQDWQNNDWESNYQTTYTYNEDNNAVSGEQLIIVNYAVLSMYYNNMQSVKSHRCQRFTASYIKVANPAAIAETRNGLENGIVVYPNPVEDAINIVLPENTTQANFSLYDIQGRQLLQQDIRKENTVSVAHLSSGMYIYTIVIDGKRMMGKIVKQ